MTKAGYLIIIDRLIYLAIMIYRMLDIMYNYIYLIRARVYNNNNDINSLHVPVILLIYVTVYGSIMILCRISVYKSE